MKGFDFLGKEAWRPLAKLGLTHHFFNINYATVMHTWIMIGILFLLLIPISWILKKKSGTACYIITSFVSYFADLTKNSLGTFSMIHFTFITGIFTFITLCNTISILPWLEEPTHDLNTTLALGATSFLYIQLFSIKSQGLWGYIKEYFSPFFPMLPLNVIGKVASVVSLSFRLFGNIFGAVIISKIYFLQIEGSWIGESFGLFSGFNFAVIYGFFGIFEGVLQAFVFTMLTVTYLAMAVQGKKPKPTEETG